MNRIIFFGAILICAFFAFAQPGPRKVLADTKSPGNYNEQTVYVRSLDVKIRANELSATTTLEMEIFNQGNQLMDGAIEFSLSEGQVISGFKLDIGKTMREGVIVEKKKARNTYETIVNRKVDPGLLELTAGNNYRLRVYPVPAHGSRKVSITIDQEMKPHGNEVQYTLPILFSKEIENYQLQIETENTTHKPEVRNGFLENLSFEGSRLFYEQKNVRLSSPHSFAIPIDRNETKVCVDARSYFSARLPYSKIQKDNNSGSSLTVFWDISSSAKNRDIVKELDFLGAYVEKFQFRKLRVVAFNNDVQETREYETPHLKINLIRSFLESLSFDGATNLEILNNSSLMLDRNIIFTDGINNFGRNNFQLSKPLHTITSSAIADPYLLKYLAHSSGGHFVELGSLEVNAVVEGMSNPVSRNIKAKSQNVSELITKYYDGYLMVSGKLDGVEGIVELEVGSGKSREKIRAGIHSNAICNEDLSLRSWRAAKINLESLVHFNGEEKLRTAGNNLGIVTPFTSLIVLETMEDYIQFDILPPAELMEEYNKNVIVQNRQKMPRAPEVKEEGISEEIIEDLVSENEMRSEWWKKRFPVKPVKNTAIAQSSTSNAAASTSIQTTVSGNSTGVRNTDAATAAPPPPTPASPPPPTVTGSTQNLVVVMKEETAQLNEVVITVPYGTVRRKSFTGSETSVTAKALEGSVAGLVANGGGPGSSATVTFRNTASGFDDAKARTVIEREIKEKKINRKQLLLLDRVELYASYLDVKNTTEGNDPSLYMEVASRLYSLGSKKEAKRVLSNLAELQLEDHQLLRAMAYVLESWKDHRSAIFIYEKILSLRDDEPQSYRDLALAKNANGQYQEAVDLLYRALTSDLEKSNDQFDGILSIMLNELNAIIDKHGKEVNLEKIDRSILTSMPVDLRIVIDWNKDQTDIDLHIQEPGNHKCFFQNKQTRNGGMISEDMTEGYGPEEYSIRKAIKGKYKIMVNYYGDRYQKEQVPSFIKVSIYKNFGRANETVEIRNMYMKGRSGMVDVAEIIFE